MGLGASIFPYVLAQTLGPVGGGGATKDRPGWWRRSGGSGKPAVLMPAPVIRMGLSVKLLGNLINLGQRNKCIHNWCLVKTFLSGFRQMDRCEESYLHLELSQRALPLLSR